MTASPSGDWTDLASSWWRWICVALLCVSGDAGACHAYRWAKRLAVHHLIRLLSRTGAESHDGGSDRSG